jgi:hypothetical protein
MQFQLETFHRNTPDEDLLADLRLTANKLSSRSITVDLYRKYGKYGSSTIEHRFGSWSAALVRAGLNLNQRKNIPDEELLSNLEFVWRKLGRQPRYAEFQSPLSKFSAFTYAKRFGSWRKALEFFVATVNKDIEDIQPETSTVIEVEEVIVPEAASRAINWRTRFLVMRRDGFKCVYCGRSPATSPGVELHIDHIHPWSKRGPTVIDNLQTLCSVCNIGKSDLPASC